MERIRIPRNGAAHVHTHNYTYICLYVRAYPGYGGGVAGGGQIIFKSIRLASKKGEGGFKCRSYGSHLNQFIPEKLGNKS